MTREVDPKDFPGAYIPFPKPVGPVPTVLITDSPQVQLCVNEVWWAYVIGCLKALYRPETWDDTPEHIVFAQQQFNELVSTVVDGCASAVPSLGCFTADFTQDSYDFLNAEANCSSTWVSGSGWQSCQPQPGDPPRVRIGRYFAPVATYISKLTLGITPPSTNVTTDITITFKLGGTQTAQVGGTLTSQSYTEVDLDVNAQADEIEVYAIESAGIVGPIYLENLKLCYVGSFPLSGSLGTWSVDLNFATGQQGFSYVVSGGGDPRAVYASGLGWQGYNCYPPDDETDLRITRTLSQAARFTRVTLTLTTTQATDAIYLLNFALNPANVGPGSAIIIDTGPIDVSATVLRMDIYTAPHITGSDMTLTSIHFEGIGPNPF